MGIAGINDYSSFINNYRVPSIPTVSVEEVKRQDQEKIAAESTAAVTSSPKEDWTLQTRPRNDAALQDISLTFNKGEDYGYLGKDSDIYSLDVENAISDMRKDDLLKQYQFFVGTSGTLTDGMDGVVVPKLY